MDIKVWARPDYLDMLKNVSDKIIKSLEILQDFWGVPYPLPKLDCFALPNYQATKPADNWGLILFKYTLEKLQIIWHNCFNLILGKLN